MADAAAAEAAAPAARPKLDDLMLAMDVVDTLRHQDQVVARELGQEGRDATLKERLRQIYESQGLEVSDRILDQGIAALKESRFVYTPSPPGLGRFLAGLWINRGRVAVGAAALVLVLLVLLGWQGWRRAADEQARIEVAEVLPRQLAAAGEAAAAAAGNGEAQARVAALVATGESAAAAGNAEGMRAATAALEELRGSLEREYSLRIVARPGEDTGVFRIPDVNQAARNYYIVVEAVTPDGDVLTLPVVNEETGSAEMVSKWGVRVPPSTFEEVRADKEDDGIVENDILGEKPRGGLSVEYRLPVQGGAITQW